MIHTKARKRICVEQLECRQLMSHVISHTIKADPSAAAKDPPMFEQGTDAVMNAATVYPLSSVPQLSSKPGAPATLYLDFTGDTSTSWLSYIPSITPAYDTDGDPTTFSSQELSNITAIWEQVSDAYSPFNLNVTTVNPGNNNNPNLEVVIGGSGAWTSGTYGGIAYVSSFAGSMSVYGPNKNKVFVFPKNLGNGTPKYVADDAAHEAGHAYGLNHQSTWSGTTGSYSLTAEYNTGTSASGPIMGYPLSDTRGMWWNGTSDYESGSSPAMQDDMSVISSSSNGFGYVTDDYGNSIAAATVLSGSTSFAANGTISTNTDADFFQFSVGSGAVTINANAGAPLSDPNPNLNVKLQLFNSSGTLLASGTQTTLSKSIATTVAAGTYYVDVSGDGTYGDVGEYGLSIAGQAPTQNQNNSVAMATDLGPVSTFSQGNLAVTVSGSDDYYVFTPVSSGSLSSNITFTNSAGNLDLYLYNSSQSLLSSSTSTTASIETVTGNVVGGQEYYLRVAGASGATNPNFTLNITGPSPTWLSNVSSLAYAFGGTSASPLLNITSGTGLLTADAGAALSNLSVTVAAGAALQIQTTQHLNSLQLLGNASTKLVQGSNSELIVNALQLGSASVLDLTNNELLWNGGSLATIQGWLDSGYNNGAWNGPGIISSSVAHWPYFGLGYSSTIVSGAVVVKYVQNGDANLDGVINSDDLALIGLGEKAGTGGWSTGDFNYDGKINVDDFLMADYALAYQGQKTT